MSFKIALIGCGNLGSRHLQALKKTSRDIEITICEPSMISREIAQQRYDEVADNPLIQKFKLIDNYEHIEKDTDLVIVATGSAERFGIVRWVVSNVSLKYMILEKVVFQSRIEFESFAELLEDKAIKVWVNCPRRMFSYYKGLRCELLKSGRVDMRITGSDWGMGCNSIHMLDIYQYLTDCSKYEWNNEGVDQLLGDSKRKGYKEFYGNMTITTDKGNLSISCDKGGMNPSEIIIRYEDMLIKIDETNKKAVYYDQNDTYIREENIDFLFQSSLTNIVVEDLIDTGTCDLTSYELSMKLHLVIIECFLDHMNKYFGGEYTRCPIT